MQKELFQEWLFKKYTNKTTVTILSQCKRVEEFHGDLDKHFSKNNCEELMYLLSYNTNDESLKIKPRHKIPINGNIKNVSASYKKAIKLYRTFCLQNSKEFINGNSVNNQKGFENTNYKNKGECSLRSIDYSFDNLDKLDEYFVWNVGQCAIVEPETENLFDIALNYFKNLEGEWFFKKDNSSFFTRIIPSLVQKDSTLKRFFHELFERTEPLIEEYIQEISSDEEDYDLTITDDDIYLAMRDEDETRKSITG